jgi:hypothetical protein
MIPILIVLSYQVNSNTTLGIAKYFKESPIILANGDWVHIIHARNYSPIIFPYMNLNPDRK